MSYKVVTNQLCPVYSTTPKKAAGGARGSIAAWQAIEVESLEPKKGDLLLVVGPPNLYPDYLGKGFQGYIEPEHITVNGTPLPGNATLDGVMALLLKLAAHFGVE